MLFSPPGVPSASSAVVSFPASSVSVSPSSRPLLCVGSNRRRAAAGHYEAASQGDCAEASLLIVAHDERSRRPIRSTPRTPGIGPQKGRAASRTPLREAAAVPGAPRSLPFTSTAAGALPDARSEAARCVGQARGPPRLREDAFADGFARVFDALEPRARGEALEGLFRLVEQRLSLVTASLRL